MSQIIDRAMRFSIMSPPSVKDVARFLSPSALGVLPRTLPSVILPVGLPAMTLAAVALSGAVSAVILLHDVGVVVMVPVVVMPFSVVRSRSAQSFRLV